MSVPAERASATRLAHSAGPESTSVVCTLPLTRCTNWNPNGSVSPLSDWVATAHVYAAA